MFAWNRITTDVFDFNGFGIRGSRQDDGFSFRYNATENLGSIRLSTCNDTINASNAADVIYGGKGDDQLFGFGGNDTLRGGYGDDELGGFTGNNLLYGGHGDDSIGGGDGGNDTIYGGPGHDIVAAQDGDDWIHGGSGRDLLFGDKGNDGIDGGRGSDELWGGAGNDTLSGGGGKDTFVFFDNGGTDIIEDFNLHLPGEKIDLGELSRIKGFGDLMRNHISQDGSNAVIDDGAGTVIILRGISMDDLNRGDFLF